MAQTRLIGSEHPLAKLTEAEVRMMRAETGKSLRQQGEEFGVHWTTVRSIVNNESWRHVT